MVIPRTAIIALPIVVRCLRFAAMALSRAMKFATTVISTTAIIARPTISQVTTDCGDGQIEEGEFCDDGSNNSDDWGLTRQIY